MKLHQLASAGHRGKKRLGRGGKRGTTSGRGTKGQRSRSGRRMRPAFRDLLIRLPKRRGFRNKPTSARPIEVSLSHLARKIKQSGSPAVIDMTFLKAAKLVPMRTSGEVKIIGKGEMPVAVTLKGIRASAGVKAAIEKSGGKIV